MITIRYTWDKQLALQSAENIYEYELKKSNKKYIGWFFLALVQFGVVGALKHNAYGFLVLGTLGILYWYGLRWQLRKIFIIKSFDKSPLANKTIILEAREEAIYSNNEIQIKYDNIKDLIQLNNAIVIYHTLGTIYIPNQAFSSVDDRTQFKTLIYSAYK